MKISKVSTGLNAAFGLKFRVAFGELPQYGVQCQRSEVRRQKTDDLWQRIESRWQFFDLVSQSLLSVL